MAPAQASPAPSIDPLPSDSDPVTEANLYEKEQHWPYRVAVRERLERAADEPPIQAGRIGVLIRVEPSGNPRIDFGAYGNVEVPAAKTDIVERANRIRLGQADKDAPNFTFAIRTRMLSILEDRPVALPMAWANPRPGFLCVFVDPADPRFDVLARALAPLQDRNGVGTILFPQGRTSDEAVYEKLRSLEWNAPFLADFLSEPYTMTVLPGAPPMPRVLLHTAEGRVLYEGAIDLDAVPELVSRIEQELDRGFGESGPSAGLSVGVSATAAGNDSRS